MVLSTWFAALKVCHWLFPSGHSHSLAAPLLRVPYWRDRAERGLDIANWITQLVTELLLGHIALDKGDHWEKGEIAVADNDYTATPIFLGLRPREVVLERRPPGRYNLVS